MKALEASAEARQLVVFELDGHRQAVELGAVERVLRMVALTPLPGAPAVVQGVFSFHGQPVAAMNVRRRLGRPERAPQPGDQLLLLRTTRRRVAFVVDAVLPAHSVAAEDWMGADTVVPGLEQVRGLVRLPGTGLVVVQDVEAFLSVEEERALERALEAPRA